MRCPGLQGCILLALIAVGALSATSANAQELVVNGGFETGSFSPWLAPPSTPNQSVFRVSGGGGHSGEYYAKLSSTALQFISQVLPTTSGADYELSFWIRRTDVIPTNFIVRWEGTTVLDLFPTNLDNFTWQRYSLSLHSNITGSLLAFGQDYFPGEYHIDDISVVQVPAPSAAAVMVVGGVVAMRRRRRGFTAGAREVAG